MMSMCERIAQLEMRVKSTEECLSENACEVVLIDEKLGNFASQSVVARKSTVDINQATARDQLVFTPISYSRITAGTVPVKETNGTSRVAPVIRVSQADQLYSQRVVEGETTINTSQSRRSNIPG